jgi:hypothetical protein
LIYANPQAPFHDRPGFTSVVLPVDPLAEGHPNPHANRYSHWHAAANPHRYTDTGIPADVYAAVVRHWHQ